VIPVSLAEVADLLGAEPRGCDLAAVADACVVDSRLAGPGSVFIALPGARTDGHDHARAAQEAGALAAVLTRPVPGVASLLLPPGLDGVAALTRLAAATFARTGAVRTIAVTGSSGKTTTKDLITVALSSDRPTVGAQASANNEIGLPLTVLRLRPETRALVLEMGARRPGNIAELCAVAPPDVSVVTNVGRAHLELFGSLETTAQTKGEIVAALGESGVAVLNADDPRVTAMAHRCAGTVVWFGRGPQADCRASEVRVGQEGTSFTVHLHGEQATVNLRLVGDHAIDNALAAAAAAHAVGMDLSAIAAGLAGVRPSSPHRMAVYERPDGAVIIDDAYNANPESMAAAVRTLMTIAQGRRTIAVLGEMAELGPHAAEAHVALGALTSSLGITEVIAVGSGATGIVVGNPRAVPVASVEEALGYLSDRVGPGTVVLCKASRVMGLERVAAGLRAPAREDEGP